MTGVFFYRNYHVLIWWLLASTLIFLLITFLSACLFLIRQKKSLLEKLWLDFTMNAALKIYNSPRVFMKGILHSSQNQKPDDAQFECQELRRVVS